MIKLQTSLQGLQEKLQVLLKNYSALEKENQQLKNKMGQVEQQEQKMAAQLKELETKLAAASLRQSNMDPADKAKLMKQIDQYIKEIDHSIQNLNP
jgi:chromosome segregation ATPase